jgi:hypothetical protein
VRITHNRERGDVREVNTCAALEEPIAVGSRLAVEAYEAKGEATRMLFANLCGGKVNISTTVNSVDDVGGGPAVKSALPAPAAESNTDSGWVPRGALLVGGLVVALAGLAIVRRRPAR